MEALKTAMFLKSQGKFHEFTESKSTYCQRLNDSLSVGEVAELLKY